MSKRLLAFAPAALAAGIMLLTGCGQADPVGQVGNKSSESTSNASAGVKTDGVTRKTSGDDLQPVECGTVEVHTVPHMLVADPTSGGIVGCTEAFNVLDEYLQALPGEPGDPFSTIELPSGWTCSKDDGEFAAVDCKKGAGDDQFAFHTEKPSEQAEPVECGPVEVHTVTHTLVAESTPAGVVGCTEAFNVVDEYLTALENGGAEGDPFSTIELPSGWTCSKDDGEFAAIDCENGEGLALHTEKPKDDDQQQVECGPIELHTVTYTLFADPTPVGTVGCTDAFNVIDEYLTALENGGAEGDPSSTIQLPSGWTCTKDDGEFEAIYCDTDEGLALHTEPVE